MLPLLEETRRRAALYAHKRALELGPPLGDGKDGMVYSTRQSPAGPSAVKAFFRPDLFARELACYQRLTEYGVGGTVQVCGHNVPRLLGFDIDLRVIEMSIVAKPYVLDFATAYLDEPPDFPDEVMQERTAHWAEVFESNWPAARTIMAHFRQFGIHLLDPSPKNIAFVGDDD